MSKITSYYHRKVNSIKWICSYVETYHACDHVINGTITIDSCSGNCEVCQEEVDECENYDCRWQQN